MYEEVRCTRGRGVFYTDTDNIGYPIRETGAVNRVLPDIFRFITRRNVDRRRESSGISSALFCGQKYNE